MYAASAIKAYNKVSVESGAVTADPHKLISMLFQGALIAVANAKSSILRKDIPAKGIAISKAIVILNEGLDASLDKTVGGELARNLSSLYQYMSGRLVAANLKNDLVVLDEVTHLLFDLKSSWDGIRPQTQSPHLPVVYDTPPKAVKPQLVYGR